MDAVVDAIPLGKDAHGVYRIAGTRITLDVVVRAFNRGATPEEIAQNFGTLQLSDIYQVIGYYLKHFDELSAYFETRDGEERELLEATRMGSARAARTFVGAPEAAVKWLADENFHNGIIRGLLRRSPGLDIVRAQDISEIAGADDVTLLIWASRQGRVILTHDVSTMIPAAQHVPNTIRRARILFVRDSLSMGTVVDEILLLDECSSEADWSSGLPYLPLR